MLPRIGAVGAKTIYRHILFYTLPKAKQPGRSGVANLLNYFPLKNLCQRGCGTARRQRLNPRWGCRHSTGYTDHVRAEPVMWTAPGVSEYRGFPIRLPGEPRWPCRLEAGDTAGWQPALLGLHLQLSCSRAQRYSLPSISIHSQKEI